MLSDNPGFVFVCGYTPDIDLVSPSTLELWRPEGPLPSLPVLSDADSDSGSSDDGHPDDRFSQVQGLHPTVGAHHDMILLSSSLLAASPYNSQPRVVELVDISSIPTKVVGRIATGFANSSYRMDRMSGMGERNCFALGSWDETMRIFEANRVLECDSDDEVDPILSTFTLALRFCPHDVKEIPGKGTSHGARLVAVGGVPDGGTLPVFDVETGEKTEDLVGHSSYAYFGCLDEKANLLYTCGSDTRCWDLRTPSATASTVWELPKARFCRFMEDYNQLWVMTQSGIISFDPRAPTDRLWTFNPHGGANLVDFWTCFTQVGPSQFVSGGGTYHTGRGARLTTWKSDGEIPVITGASEQVRSVIGLCHPFFVPFHTPFLLLLSSL